MNMIDGLILFWIHKNLTLVDLFICMGTMSTRIFSNILSFTTFDANIYDEDYDFIIDIYVIHASNPQDHEHNILPYKHVQIYEHYFQPKECDYN